MPIACFMCFAKVSLSSIVTPNYLTDFIQFISVFPIFSLLENLDDLFENKIVDVFCFALYHGIKPLLEFQNFFLSLLVRL